jgi:GNAT superfamily N-acetyltransferase
MERSCQLGYDAGMQLDQISMRDLPIVGEEAQVPAAVVPLDESTYASWGPPLTLPQYLARERRLRAVPFSRGLRTWVLREGDAVLASCESYEVPLALAGPKGKPARRGLVHGIASVFVDEKLRGHGYASTMLKGVHEQLAGAGALGCYLMSEIGPSLYARLGYVARPLRLCRYAAADPARERLPAPLPWTWLQADDLPSMLAQRYKVARPGLALETTAAQLGWHLARSRYYAQTLGRKPSEHVGARVGDAFVVWQPSYPKELLRVLMLYPGERLATPGSPVDPRGPELEAVRNVLHAARFTAAELGLSHLEVWENASNSAYLRGGVRLASDDIPMLRPLIPEVRGEDWIDYERCHWL